MTAISAGSFRLTKQKSIKSDRRPLAANAVTKKGGLAMVITAGSNAGYYTEANTTDVGVVVGKFDENVDNTGGSNGALLANVEFFRERWCEGLINDTGTPVTAAMRETAAYLLDDQTVTGAPSSTPVGVIYDVTADGKLVWVEGRVSPPEVQQVPTIQSGTTTLVAGTKTVTGVTLTANSKITMSMRDPGAGAITGFATFDAPVASRNAGAGSFVINAIDDSKATITTAVCTVDYTITG